MYFHCEAFTPAQTPEGAPVITRLGIYPGVVTRIWVGFPAGCYGLVHMQIWYCGWQVWPYTPQTSYHWENYVYVVDDRYPIVDEPLELVIKTWNDDDSYDHTLTFACTIEPAPPEEELRQLQERLVALGLLRG